MRGGRAGTHEIDQRIILVADISGTALPIRRARIVRDDPGAAGIHALGDDAKAGDQVGALQHAVTDHCLDLMAQAAGVELRLQQRYTPALALEGKWRQLEIEVFHFGRAVSERQRAGDDRARRGAADEVEIIAQQNVFAIALAEQRFDAFEKCHRQRAAHAAAVERQYPLGAGTEQVAVARILEGCCACVVHADYAPRRDCL